jgi:hypothetical protein
MPACTAPSRSALALALGLAFSVASQAQYTSTNRDVLVPNTGLWPSSGVNIGGTQFINLGLQGVGRVAANRIDSATGESLGSISGMEITGFTNNGNGSWSGTFNFLPDRGYNAGAVFSNYAARINTFNFTFTPYTGAAPTALQNQIAMNFTGSTRFTYDHDNNPLTPAIYTTGLLPAASGSALFGTTLPTVAATTTQSDGSYTNRLTVDAEALALDKRAGKAGSGWIGDEYGANIYRFDANKQIVGVLPLPAALVPRTGGNIDFLSDPPTSGRRVNQGFEGVAQSPDGTRLFALLQSATLQDSGTGNQGRSNTRLVVYDVSASDVPGAPLAQYVIQLPRIDDNGATGGVAVNRNGAQSEIVALNSHQLLILSRDGNGRGAAGSPVFKSVLLADLNGATNINGQFDASTAAVAPGGVLNASVTPISWTEALNMLGKLGPGAADIELAKFGLNINAAPGDINTISEKWEALSLVPVGDPAAPNDYFLFVGNDNDFQSASGRYMLADGSLANYNAGLENDSVVLAWRVQVVPEPATYALMLGGLAAVGLWARRRSAR